MASVARVSRRGGRSRGGNGRDDSGRSGHGPGVRDSGVGNARAGHHRHHHGGRSASWWTAAGRCTRWGPSPRSARGARHLHAEQRFQLSDTAPYTVTSWDPNVNGEVNTIAFNGGNCADAYIGGKFTMVGSTAVKNIAEINTTRGAVVSRSSPTRAARSRPSWRPRATCLTAASSRESTAAAPTPSTSA